MIPLMNAYWAKDGGPKELDFLNESENTMNAATYASLYNAAHVLTARAGITLVAETGTTTANEQHGGSGTWFSDLAAHLPGGANEVDAFEMHPYPYSDDSFTPQTTVDSDFYTNWKNIQLLYSQAVAAGFAKQPWYFSEVGTGLNWGISQAQQASDITYILNQVANVMNGGTPGWPHVVFVSWYAVCDDTSGAWGLLNGSCTAPSVRPSFTALQNWIAANQSKISE